MFVPLQQLFPHTPSGGEIDLTAAYLPDLSRWRAAQQGSDTPRPWATVNMVASVDGAVTVAGRSGGLSDEVDRKIFMVLRSMADVVMVGAGTARAERYGPARIPDEHAALRTARGQAPVPPIAVVSQSGLLASDLPMFDPELVGDGPVPIIITCGRNEPNVQRLGSRAEALVAGDEHVDMQLAMSLLAERGINVVVSEGGPTLNAAMVEQGLLDELCLTMSPLTVAGGAGRIVDGDTELSAPVAMELGHILETGGALYTRWRYCSTPS